MNDTFIACASALPTNTFTVGCRSSSSSWQARRDDGWTQPDPFQQRWLELESNPATNMREAPDALGAAPDPELGHESVMLIVRPSALTSAMSRSMEAGTIPCSMFER